MGSGHTNFLSTVGAQSLGTSDLDKMVAAIDKQSLRLIISEKKRPRSMSTQASMRLRRK